MNHALALSSVHEIQVLACAPSPQSSGSQECRVLRVAHTPRGGCRGSRRIHCFLVATSACSRRPIPTPTPRRRASRRTQLLDVADALRTDGASVAAGRAGLVVG